LTLSATQAGLGAALLRAPLVARELASGELVKLFDQGTWTTGATYYLCRRVDADLPDGAQRLAAWLLESIKLK